MRQISNYTHVTSLRTLNLIEREKIGERKRGRKMKNNLMFLALERWRRKRKKSFPSFPFLCRRDTEKNGSRQRTRGEDGE